MHAIKINLNTKANSFASVELPSENININYGFYETQFGTCFIATYEDNICFLGFVTPFPIINTTKLLVDHVGLPQISPRASYCLIMENGINCSQADIIYQLHLEWPEAILADDNNQNAKIIDRIFNANSNNDNNHSLLVKGTKLQLKVWQALLNIPKGELVTYSDIAKMVGNDKAVRAVASSIGKNSISYLIPCHRVIGKAGTLNGYRWGIERKQKMIEYEKNMAAGDMLLKQAI